MAAAYFVFVARDANGAALSGAKANVYDVGTTTQQAVYVDAALTIPATNPVLADANGYLQFYRETSSGQDIDITDATEADTLLQATIPAGENQAITITEATIEGINGLQEGILENISDIRTVAANDLDISLVADNIDEIRQVAEGQPFNWSSIVDKPFLTLEAFGAVGDARAGFDGNTDGTATFRSSAAPFTEGDVGKVITIDDPDDLLGNFEGTIVDFNSPSEVVLSAIPPFIKTNCFFVWGTDNADALDLAALSNRIVFIEPRGYLTTREDVYGLEQRGAGLIGLARPSRYMFTTQSGGPNWSSFPEPCLVYAGPTSTGIAPKSVVRVSSAATGIQPDQTFEGVSLAGRFDQFSIFANRRAWCGFYAARWSGVDVSRLVIRGAGGHNFFMAHCFDGRVGHINAASAHGCGITIGTFGSFDGTTQPWSEDWSTAAVNAIHFEYLQGLGNGHDGTFDELTNPRWGYGVGIFAHRGCKFTHVLGENNDGPGLYWSPTSNANAIDMLYTESNCSLVRTHVGAGSTAIDEGRTTQASGINVYYEGQAGGGHSRLKGAFGQSSRFLIKGTAPSRAPEGGLVIEDFANGGGIEADFDNYRVLNASQETADNISGHFPAGNPPNSITPSTPVTTLYVRSGGSDANNGRTSGTAFQTLQKAIDIAKIVVGVTTIDCTGTTLTNQAVDLKGLTQNLTIEAGTFDNVGAGNYALDIIGGIGQCTLTIHNTAQLGSMKARGAHVIVTNTVSHTGTLFTNGYLVQALEGSKIELRTGLTADANGERGMNLQGGSEVHANASWHVDNATVQSGLGVFVQNGGGNFYSNLASGSSNSAWITGTSAIATATGNAYFSNAVYTWASGGTI